jgi:uncharacterized membrane protein (DUF485 family)
MTKMGLHSEEFLRMLMRRQFLLSASIASVFIGIIVIVPILNTFAKDIMTAPFFGFTVTWFLLGFAIFPILIVLAWLFVRQSNNFEDEAIGMVDASTLPVHDDSASADVPAGLGH